MTTPVFRAGNQQWFGLAKETVRNTAQAAPTMWIPVDTPTWKPVITALVDQALRGNMGMDQGQTQGMRHDEVTYKTYIYADSVFPHLIAALGGTDNVTNLTAPTLTLGATSTTGGTLPAGATYWKVTATASGSESAGSNEVTATLTGSTSSQVLSWATITGATGYNIYRGTSAGNENVLVASVGNVTTYTDTGAAGTANTTPPATGSFTHKVSLNNSISGSGQPPTYTGFLGQSDGTVIQIPGMVLSDLKFTFKADTLPTVDVSWIGLPGTPITAPTNTPSTKPPMPPFTANIVVGGVALGNRSDCSFDLKRNATPIAVMNGTQSPMAISAGPLTVTGSLVGVYQGSQTDPDLQNLLTNTQPTLSVSIYTQNDASHPLTLQASKIAYDSSDPTGSNNGIITITSAFKALMNATDALDGVESPLQAQIVTTSATAF